MSDVRHTPILGGPAAPGGADSRRRFIKRLGIGGTLVLLPSVVAACDDDDDDQISPSTITLDFGTETDVLNYAFALEQLEAAFYTRVLEDEYSGMTQRERTLLTDIRDHEIAHRELFEAALTGSARKIPADLEFDFGDVAFDSRTAVLATARTFEDLGVGAYNGAGRYLVDTPAFLVLAGKIVSVEARHAAAIRLLIDVGANEQGARTGAFAPDAFDDALTPQTVLAAAAAYLPDGVTIAVTGTTA